MYVKNYLNSLSKGIWRLRFHTSIDTLPIGIWFEVHETQDQGLIKRNGILLYLIFFLAQVPLIYMSIWLEVAFLALVFFYKYAENALVLRAWEKIYNGFIREIGLSNDYLEYLDQIKKLAMMKLEWVINPSPINKSTVRLKEAELEDKQSKKKADYNEIIAIISKSQGYRIDKGKVTVREFYSYIKINGK